MLISISPLQIPPQCSRRVALLTSLQTLHVFLILFQVHVVVLEAIQEGTDMVATGFDFAIILLEIRVIINIVLVA